MKEDIILMLVFVAVIIFGYFIVTRLDLFWQSNRKHIKNKQEVQSPSCVMLRDGLSDDEILDEIKNFKAENDKVSIVVYNSDYNNFEKIFGGNDDI